MEPLLLYPKLKGYRTIAYLPIEEVIPVLNETVRLLQFGFPVAKHRFRGLEAYPVSVTSERILTYTKGLCCGLCGVGRVAFFAIQSNNNEGQHLNAWGFNAQGQLVLFTSDHIIPKNRGGKNSLDNRQPSCSNCNFKKQDRLPGELMSPHQIQQMEQARINDARHKRELNGYQFHVDDIAPVKSKKVKIIQLVISLEMEIAALTGGAGFELLTLRLPPFVSKLLTLGVVRLKEHPEQKWDMSLEQMSEIIKLLELTHECLPEIFQCGPPHRFSRRHE